MNSKMIQTGYLLGVSLILASILYFFAANWQGFERLTKIMLSIGLVLLFYGLHFLVRKIGNQQYFLSDWMLVAASVVFGLSVALIGQIYNSHADSYWLFLVWFVPVFILSLITKYVPFYVFSFILAHLAIFFFLSPSTYFASWTDYELFGFIFTVALLNAVLFYLTYRTIISTKTILYMAFIMFHSMFIYLTINNELPFHFLSNLFYIGIFIVSFYYWFKVKLHRPLLILTGLFATFYVLQKGFYWMFLYYGMWMLLFFLLIAALLVFLSVIAVSFLKKGKKNRILTQLVTVIVTIIATLFSTLAISGLFFILFPQATADVLFFFSICALITPGLFTKWPIQIKYTLLSTGFLLAIGASSFSIIIYNIILLILLGAGIFTVPMRSMKVFLYILANIVFGSILSEWFEVHGIFLGLLFFNVLYYMAQKKEIATKYSAFIIGLFAFLTLTVLDVENWLSIIYNFTFFLTVTIPIFTIKMTTRRWEWTTCLIFWFLFIAYKYYEYLWLLIHKSILFLALGIIIISTTIYFERKRANPTVSTKRIQYKTPFLISLILLQLGFISYQSYTNETLLKEGELIKLELMPIDPRSMLQGDYIILRYGITEMEQTDDYRLWNKKIKVVLRENNGIYDYAGYYQINGEWNKPYNEEQGDIMINGKSNGPNEVVYGIESYFVPEGTGVDLQNEVEYAYVRVGKTGNAIIEYIE
ncbi:GDYXXLXY domain-containing protein [Pseudogracilibacillus auburnensis]|uniref:GDYXXLXY domain-containing protein n=1 Tax=Pseudogracilibacillus auburnensis TaxID=1494959 RepID=UPI001A959036|nr:GDYXXLXY domain-containing protein [Pseudogracilibacillus auburnensis]MBO1001362.1 GDYXXLXY domain-containing protein [Pseudogracilibacillus auburnensis]